MTYNAFTRGGHPVGVRTIELEAEGGNNWPLTTEIYYPATEDNRGKDLDSATTDKFKVVDAFPEAEQTAVRDAAALEKKWPLIIYSHGGYGHRRELSDMCSFLASHGFVVAAPDFPGDHLSHMYSDNPAIKEKPVDESAAARPSQVNSLIDRITSGRYPFLSSIVNADEIGGFGVSMGGFTSLALNSIDSRPKACVAIAPMFGKRSPAPQILRLGNLLRVDDWKGDVSTFLIAGSADALVIADDVRDLFAKVLSPKRLAVLDGAGHMHWADNAELVHETFRTNYMSGNFPDPEIDAPAIGRAFRPFAELCPAEHARDTMRGICLAHFEANLKGSAEAEAFLADDLAGTFAALGVGLEVTAPHKKMAGA